LIILSKTKTLFDQSSNQDMTPLVPNKSEQHAKDFKITILCELEGPDIKPLNDATMKGNYMLKIGERTLDIPNDKSTKSITLSLYKMKGLRGFLRRACETRIFELLYQGFSIIPPCTPNAMYPHEEILQAHLTMGYHIQGSCKENPCFIYRLFGGLERISSITITPPIIAKSNSERLPTKAQEYLKEHITDLLHINTAVFSTGDAALKTETFNIINRDTDNAVNNYMKHNLSGVFKFTVDFIGHINEHESVYENIGFFIDSIFQINNGSVQLGAMKRSGSGRVNIGLCFAESNRKFESLTAFITEEIRNKTEVKVGSRILTNIQPKYALSHEFLVQCHEKFLTKIKNG